MIARVAISLGIGLIWTGATSLGQSPITISSSRVQSDFNGAIGAGQSAPIAAAAFDFTGQPQLSNIQSVSITLTVIDGDTGFGPNGVAETPYPPDGEEHGDDDFDVNSLGLRLDGLDLGQNLLLNTLDSFQEPFGPEDYITRTITGAPANQAALLNALQDGLLVATISDSTGISQSNGLRIPERNFAGNQQILVTLALTGSAAPVRAFSAKSHGNAGVYDIELPLTGTTGVECRSGGANGDHTIVFSFANTLTSVGEARVTAGSGEVASSMIGSDAHEYIVQLRAVANAQRITVSLSNVLDSAGQNMNSVAASMDVLLGDTNADRTVNSGDAQQTRNRSGQTTDSINFRSDVNIDGAVNSGDAFIVRGRSGNTIP